MEETMTFSNLFKEKPDPEYQNALDAFEHLKSELSAFNSSDSLDQEHLELIKTYSDIMKIQKRDDKDYQGILQKIKNDALLKNRPGDQSSLLHTFRTFHEMVENATRDCETIEAYIVKHSGSPNAKKLETHYADYMKTSSFSQYSQSDAVIVQKVLMDMGELKKENPRMGRK